MNDNGKSESECGAAVSVVRQGHISNIFRLIQIASTPLDATIFVLVMFAPILLSAKLAFWPIPIIAESDFLSIPPITDRTSAKFELAAIYRLAGIYPFERILALISAFTTVWIAIAAARSILVPPRSKLSLPIGATFATVTLLIDIPFIISLIYFRGASHDDIANRISLAPATIISKLISKIDTVPSINANTYFDLYQYLSLSISFALITFLIVGIPTTLQFLLSVTNRRSLGHVRRSRLLLDIPNRLCLLEAAQTATIIRPVLAIMISVALINLLVIIGLKYSNFLDFSEGALIKAKAWIELLPKQMRVLAAYFSVYFSFPVLIAVLVALLHYLQKRANISGSGYTAAISAIAPSALMLVALAGVATANPLISAVSVTAASVCCVFIPPTFLAAAAVRFISKSLRRFLVELRKQQSSPTEGWLFLRSFALDAIWVRWPFDVFRFLPVVGRRRDRLEHILADCVFRFGPLRAVGNPSDPQGDHGIPREYFADDAWQPFVTESVDKSRGIVFLFGAGAHISWEIAQLRDLGAIEKTLFVVPPNAADIQHFLANSGAILRQAGVPAAVLEHASTGQCICFYHAEGGWVVVLNKWRSALDYRMAVHKALVDMSSTRVVTAGLGDHRLSSRR